MTTAPAPEPTNTPAHGDRPPHAGARLFYGKTPTDWAIRIVLALVMTAALAVGTWSIYALLTQVFHMPWQIAALGCGMFDVAALFFALLSQRYAITTDSGLAPRAAMLAMISTSAWVNWNHARMEGWGTVGGVILGSAPVIAELAFEMFHRYAHRETLRQLGRVAQTLPTLGKWSWIAHPMRSGKTLDAHIKAALTEHEALAGRREELATERARRTITLDAQPEVTLTRDAHAHTPALTGDAQPTERPALTPAPALNTIPVSAPTERAQDDAQPLTDTTERAHAHALSPNAQPDALTQDAQPTRSERTPKTAERAHTPALTKDTSSERTAERAQNTLSLTDRKALKAQQDALTLALFQTLNRRPEWTDIRDALTSAGLPEVSRPTAQRIRERVEKDNPALTEQPAQTAAEAR